MAEVIALRIEPGLLNKIDKLSKEGSSDRSTVIRQLILNGYNELLKEKAAKLYLESKITISEAAGLSGFTILEMEHYLVDKGFKSEYSIEDLEKEIALLG